MQPCARCQTPILVESNAVRINTDVYCCSNCAEAATGGASAPGFATCSHCGVSIVNPMTQVTREEWTFCCANCAAAMAQERAGGTRIREDVAAPTVRSRTT